ncbi:hypothetical protein R6Q57_022712 [Mikania cordata]
MGVGRKLKSRCKRQRLADKSYKKSRLGSELKKPFARYSHAKGVVQEKIFDKELYYICDDIEAK